MNSSARFSTICAAVMASDGGDSLRETIDEAIRAYKREVERLNEKVEKLESAHM